MRKLRFNSFATRLSVATILFTIIIFTIVCIIFYTYSSRSVIRDAITNTHSRLQTMAIQISDKLTNTKVAVLNAEWIIRQNANNADSLSIIISHLVNDNEVIVGSAIAFEPGYGPHKDRPTMLYASENNDNVSTRLMNSDYRYSVMDWYQIPKLLKKDYWSEPYYDRGGGNMIMSTFSHPLFNENGEVFAILTADISLKDFTALVSKLEPYQSSYSFLLSRNGYYITHYYKDRIMNETIFSNALESKNEDYARIGKEMLAGKTGTIEFHNETEDSYAFYCPIPDVNWSLCNVSPIGVITKDLYKTTRTIVIIFIIGITLLFISILQIIRHLFRPLETFSLSAKEIAKGNFNIPLPKIKSHDEMKDLHDSFEHMQKSLDKYIQELTETTSVQERINSELNIAFTIQKSMIPKGFPERKDMELFAILHPAREVGGDLYNYAIHDNKLSFIIGDVSGKGVPASLVMSMVSTLFNSIGSKEENPAILMKDFNETMSKSNDLNMFVTMIAGILDLGSGILRICNAGHNAPIVIMPNTPATFLNLEQNIPIGIIPDFNYKETLLTLDANTKLVLYTDGITEAEDSSHSLYGDKKLINIVENSKNENVEGIGNKILADVKLHVNNTLQSDDLTLLILDYKQNNQEPMKKEIILANDIREIGKLETFTDEIGKELNLPLSVVTSINLALEEALTNIIMYAFPPLDAEVIHLYCTYRDSELIFLLTDNGAPFDPTKASDPDIDAPLGDRPIGGLGIMLIRKIMNEVTYQRINNTNHLTLKKKI